jgi:hypothetical protein
VAGLKVPAHKRDMLSGGLEVPPHAREASNNGSGETPVCWVASDYVFSCCQAVSLGAAALWSWVLHDGCPIGVVVSTLM